MKKAFLLLSALLIAAAILTFFVFNNTDVAIVMSVSGTISSIVSFFVKTKNSHADFEDPNMGTANKSVNDR